MQREAATYRELRLPAVRRFPRAVWLLCDAPGTREILECWFDGRPIRDEYLIVDGGKLAGTDAHSYADPLH